MSTEEEQKAEGRKYPQITQITLIERRIGNTNSRKGALCLTLKALANLSPGSALKPWVKKGHIYFVATLKELRRDCDSADGDATLSGLRLQKDSDAFFPGLHKAQPWAEISQRFQRYCCAPRAECWIFHFPFAIASAHRLESGFVRRARRGTSALSKRRVENFLDLANAFSVRG